MQATAARIDGDGDRKNQAQQQKQQQQFSQPSLAFSSSSSSDVGSPDSIANLSAYLPKDERECVWLLQRSAAQRHPGALSALGTAHEQGRGGLRSDRTKAMELYHSALDAGYEPARKHLARLRVPKESGGWDDAALRKILGAAASPATANAADASTGEPSVVSESPYWPDSDALPPVV